MDSSDLSKHKRFTVSVSGRLCFQAYFTIGHMKRTDNNTYISDRASRVMACRENLEFIYHLSSNSMLKQY